MKALEKYQKIGRIPFRPRSEYSVFGVSVYLVCWCVKWVGANWITRIIRINAKNGNFEGAKSVMDSVRPQVRVRHKNRGFISFR
jgi:hypothetical protein